MNSWAGSGPRADARAARRGGPRVPRAPQDRRSARHTLQKEGLACQWFTTIAHERGEIGLWLTGILTNHAIACAQLLLP